MIEIITQKVEMPKYDERRYQKKIEGKNFIVYDTEDKNKVVYAGKYENASLACHNLNKIHYLQLLT